MEGDTITNRQLVIVIAATTTLALALAWTIERAQVRRFVAEFEAWWAEREGAKE